MTAFSVESMADNAVDRRVPRSALTDHTTSDAILGAETSMIAEKIQFYVPYAV